jgi:hypothetical protein
MLVLFAAAGFSMASMSGCAADDGQNRLSHQLTHLHEQMNAEDINAIYKEADPGFREGTSKADFAKLFLAIHRRMGDAGSGFMKDTEVESSFSGTYVTMWIDTDFTYDPDAEERIVWRGHDGVYKLYRYDIQSRLLHEWPQVPANR